MISAALALGLTGCGKGSVGEESGPGPGPTPKTMVKDPAATPGLVGPGTPAGTNPNPTPETMGPQSPSAQGLTNLSNGPLSGMCKTATVGRARLWRLSRDQIRNTLKTTLGLDLGATQLNAFNDGNGLFFRNETDALRFRKADTNSWTLTTTDLGRNALGAIKKAAVCPDLAAPACAPKLVDYVGAKLFRRPLRPDEKTRYTKLYTDTLMDPSAGGDGAAQALTAAFLQSPYFLYRSEIGKALPGKKGVGRLTGYELASALSYTMWQTSPDDELIRAAGAGELDATEGLRKQAARMIEDARFAGFYNDMLSDLTRASRMDEREGADAVKDAATVMKTLDTELQSFVKAVLAENPTLDEVLNRKKVTIGNDVAQYRNLGGVKSGTAPVTIDLPTPVAGLLSLGAISFANAGTDHPSPVKRGVMVRERFLCSPVPPPPESVVQALAPAAMDVVTNRQKYEKTMAPPTCNACHRLFNPMGYAFEAFDHLGKYRTMDAGKPVDLTGAVVETRDANVMFANLSDLARGLAASEQVGECFALNGFRMVSGRFETPGDLCYVSQIYQQWKTSGRNLKTLAIEMVASDSFSLRTVEN